MPNSTIQRPSLQVAAGRDPPRGAQRYRIIKTLGAGGMGDVYLAEDLKLPRHVAIKTIRKDLCENAEIRKRIERECQLHAKIGSHPHIVTLYDQLEEGKQISLVMEYVEGQTLRDLQQRIAQEGSSLPWRQAVEIICQCLGALARIHTLGIVHRDVKPGNILLGRDDSGGYCAKLMDFGIARPEVQEGTLLTRTDSGSPGTPLYMAPEQIDPQTFGPITPATDIYAIGVVLYQLLSGKPPFEGSITQILTGHLTREPPPLTLTGVDTLSPPLRAILQRALKKMPQERFPTAKAFCEALEGVLRGDPQAASVDAQGAQGALTQMGYARTLMTQPEEAVFKKGATLLSTTHPQPRRGGMVWLGAGGMLLVVAALVGWFMIKPGGPPDKPAPSPPAAAVAPAPVKSTVETPGGEAKTPSLPVSPPAPETARSGPAAEPRTVVTTQPSATLTPPLPTATQPSPDRSPTKPPGVPGVSPEFAVAHPPSPQPLPPPGPGGSALDVLKQLRTPQEEVMQPTPEPPVANLPAGEPPAPGQQTEPKADKAKPEEPKPVPPKAPQAAPKPKVAASPKPPKATPRAAPVSPSTPYSSPGGGWGDVKIYRDETYRKQ